MIETVKQRDTSSWSQEYRHERTSAARAARAASSLDQRETRDHDRQKILEWLDWMGYSTTKILCFLVGRSRRILDEMVADGLIHHQQQLIKAGSRVKKHGGQYLPMTTVFLTRAGHTKSGAKNPLKRHPDKPDMVRHNLLSQVAMLHLLDSPYPSRVSSSWTAYPPGTQHLADLSFKAKFKPDLQVEIQPPTRELPCGELERRTPYGLFFIEVERSRKKSNELERLANKLKTLLEYGKPVLVTETRTFMSSLLNKLSEIAPIEHQIIANLNQFEDKNEDKNEDDFMKGIKIMINVNKRREQQIWCLILQEECPDLLALLP